MINNVIFKNMNSIKEIVIKKLKNSKKNAQDLFLETESVIVFVTIQKTFLTMEIVKDKNNVSIIMKLIKNVLQTVIEVWLVTESVINNAKLKIVCLILTTARIKDFVLGDVYQNE